MPIYRATNKLISRLMSCRIPALAIAVNKPEDMHTHAGISGREFAELIDPASRTFSMPRQFISGGTRQLVVLMAQQIGDNGESPIAGKLYFNSNFEASLAGNDSAIQHLMSNGWLENVNVLADDSVPAPFTKMA